MKTARDFSRVKPNRIPILLFILLLEVGIIVGRSVRVFHPLSEKDGAAPTLVLRSLPLNGSTHIEQIRCSPSGQYLLIEVATNAYPLQSRDCSVLLLDATRWEVVSRIAGAWHARWGRHDSIWVWTSNCWAAYEPPFEKPKMISHDYGQLNDPWDCSAMSECLAVATHIWQQSYWTISVHEKGVPSFEVAITPEYPPNPSGERKPSLSFSPDGTLLAVVFRGWAFGREQPGPEELWIVDIATHSARHLHTGKYKWWQIWDSATQGLTPSWSSDGGTIIYGGGIFEIEEIDVQTGRTKSLFAKNSDAYDIALSNNGGWIRFIRGPSGQSALIRHYRCMGVLSRDGKRIVHMPDGFITWPFLYPEWHPHLDRLLVVVPRLQQKECDLLCWDFESE